MPFIETLLIVGGLFLVVGLFLYFTVGKNGPTLQEAGFITAVGLCGGLSFLLAFILWAIQHVKFV